MRRILVVEDEANIRKFVAVNLAQRGYIVDVAKDAGEALAQLRVAAPDLLVLDIKLPDLTGWELLAKMAQEPIKSANFPVLVMTASPTDGHITNQEQYSAVVEVLLKPFSTTMLIESVERALGPAVSTRNT